MNLADVVQAMAKAGLTGEQIANVTVELTAGQRATRQARNQRYRETIKTSQDAQDVSQKGSNGSPQVLPNASPNDSITLTPSLNPSPPSSFPPKTSSLRSASETNKTRARENSFAQDFLEFKEIYPKRSGSQPWARAERKFLSLCSVGKILPSDILDGCRKYARAMADDDPNFVAQAITWLNQERWKDEHLPRQPRAGPIPIPPQNNRNVYIGLDDQKRLLGEYYAKYPDGDPNRSLGRWKDRRDLENDVGIVPPFSARAKSS